MAKKSAGGSSKSTKSARPSVPMGSKTKGQTTRQSGIVGMAMGWGGGVIGQRSNVPGFLSQPSPATYTTYRRMRCNPTIAIARAALFAPAKANAWTYEAQDGVPDERVQFVQEQFDHLKPRLIQDVLRAVEYGWQPFERVYSVDDEGRYVYSRAKALLPDESEPIVDDKTLHLIGVDNNGTRLSLQKAAVLTYDAEGDDPYGRSIYENIREDAWWPWQDTAKKLLKYYTKMAGVIPIIRYPMGKSQDASGQEVDNFENAATTLRSLGVGDGVAVPTQIDGAFEDILRGGANVADLMAWQISFLETKSGGGAEMSTGLRDYERLMVRGMLQPERSILEGQFGTKADAGSHADLGLLIATDLNEWCVREINRLFVDPLLAVNFGPDARGSVYIKASPLLDDEKAFIRGLVQATLSANPDLLMAVSDFDAMLDSTGVPKSAEVVDIPAVSGQPDPANPADPNAPAPTQPPQPTPSMLALARRVRQFNAMGLVRQ